ncbi:MAG: RHS repeat-associated core domain-containing protein [Methyloglobulus sp.]|nr:RHS repeat protein [Methyloglobulus sp.]
MKKKNSKTLISVKNNRLLDSKYKPALAMLLLLGSSHAQAEFLGNTFVVAPFNQTVVARWGCVRLSDCSMVPSDFTITQAPTHGIVTFGQEIGTITSLPQCNGKSITRQAAYYTWVDGSKTAQSDTLGLHWSGGDGIGCSVDNNIQILKAPSPKNQGKDDPDCPKTCDGNPINAGTGNKFQIETDYVGSPHTGLEIRRYYNSQNSTETTFGTGWRSSWQHSITSVSGGNTVQVNRADGRAETYAKTANGSWQADPDVTNELTVLTAASNQQTGWQIKTKTDDIERYSLDGRLVSMANRAGQTTTFSYDSNNRVSVLTGHFGHKMTFAYDDNNRISRITLPDSSAYQYGYDDKNNLVSVTYPDAAIRKYLYENTTFVHALTGILDENGKRFATYTYDAQGRATSTQHAGGAELTTIAYNADNTATVTDALGNKHGYNFTTQFDVVKPTGVTGTPIKNLGAKAFTYDDNGFVASNTDFNGNITTCQRDSDGLELSRTEAAGTPLARTITTEWHSIYHLPIKIVEPNRVTNLAYDNKGNLIERTISSGSLSRAWQYSYNADGQVLTINGPRTDLDDVTQFGYDNKGNLVSIVDALGHKTLIIAYDANSRPLTVVNANGLITTLTYNLRGQVISSQTGNELTTYTRDALGQVTKASAPDGNFIAFAYDDAHRLIKVSDQLDNHIDYTLDAVGNQVKQNVYDPSAVLTQTVSKKFDSNNRLAAIVGANGQSTLVNYDDNDNPVAISDALGNQTKLIYDALNRLINSLDPAGHATKQGYDVNDNLTVVTDPLTHKTQYGYDGLGNPLSLNSPDTGLSKFSYDSAGNKISAVDARGKQINYGYDNLNRLTKITYDGNQTINFVYDQGVNGIGHLVQMNDESGITQWQYDKHGRTISKTLQAGQLSFTTQYGYNAQGQLTTMTYPSGKVIQLTYSQGQITAVDANGNPLLTDIHYQPFGNASDWVFGNGKKTVRDYDLDGRITAYDMGERSRQLSYDKADRVIGYKDTDLQHDQSFAYDAVSRLLGITTPATQTDYAYDANGNRTRVNNNGTNLVSTLDSNSNRLLNLSENNVAKKAYQYDASGNTINDGSHTFTFDGRNRLVKASGSFGTETYLINGLGQRVEKLSGKVSDLAGDANEDGKLSVEDLRLIVLMTQGKQPGKLIADCNHDGKVTIADATCTQAKIVANRNNPGGIGQAAATYFVYDEAGHLLGEYDKQGKAVQETVWLGDMPTAVLKDDKAYYVYADHLNAPRAISDATGKTVWRWDSEVFGTTPANEDPDQDGTKFAYNLRFPGQYFDQSTGLHYNGFRDYDPATGRYVESDPIGLDGGINTYGYVFNRPLSIFDRTGLAGEFIIYFNPISEPVLYLAAVQDNHPDGVISVYMHANSNGAIGRKDDKGNFVPDKDFTYADVARDIRNLQGYKPYSTIKYGACNSGVSDSAHLSTAEKIQRAGVPNKSLAPNGYWWAEMNGVHAHSFIAPPNTFLGIPLSSPNRNSIGSLNTFNPPIARSGGLSVYWK